MPKNQTTQAKKNQWRNFIFVVAGMLLFIIIFALLLRDNDSERKVTNEEIKLVNPLDHSEPESLILEKYQKSVDANNLKTDSLQRKFDDGFGSLKTEAENKQKLLEERVADLEKKLKESQEENNVSKNGIPSNKSYNGKLFPNRSEYDRETISNDDVGMREDKLTISYPDVQNQPTRTIDNYVPSGTHVKAIVLGGADASAAVNAQADPSVTLIRLIDDGTLPNHKKSHLKDCVITAAATGDVSSSRGRIRTERMSCVFPNGQVFDEAVEGTVFDKDGKNDVRGNRYDATGEFTSRAFVAGSLSGLSEGLSQTFTTNSISAEGNVQTVNSGKIFQYGGAKGVGKAMDRLADYNIKRAEQLHPIIQLSAGNEVNVVFLKGFYLDEKKHDKDQENRTVSSNMFDMKSVSTASATSFSPDERTLPLSADQVRRLQERGKELGLKVTSTGS